MPLRVATDNEPVAVLLIEDSPLDAVLITEELRAGDAACEVHRVDHRASVLEALSERSIDLVLSDYSLPGYDGLQALADVKARRPDLPFIFVSGALGEERAIESLRSGATDYVLKDRLERLRPAVDRAVRESRERLARRKAAELSQRLLSVTAALAAVLTPDEVVATVVQEGAASLSAASGACWLPDARGANLVATARWGHGPVWPPASRVAPDASNPVGAAYQARDAQWVSSARALKERFPAFPAPVSPEGRGASATCLPLMLQGKVLAVLSFAFEREHLFEADEQAMLLALAGQAAQALERARLYEAERAARRRFALLARAGEELSSSIDYERTLENVANLALPALADFCFFDVVQATGEVRRVPRALNPEVEAVLAQTRWQRSDRKDVNVCALSSGKTAFHPVVDDAWLSDVASGPEHYEAMKRLGFGSMVSVRLRGQHETLGALTLCFAESGRRYTTLDVELIEELAARAATALENARLYEIARVEQERAQAASRAKDEFIAMVSHELRTPLTAILGWVQILKLQGWSERKRERALETIERNARAQAQLVEDLLDMSRIIAGKFKLELKPLEPTPILEAALESARPAAEAKQLDLSTRIDGGGAQVLGDPERLQQVLGNLLSNAVKFSAPGGRVEVRLDRRDGALELQVSDTGQGIAPEVLPHIFERFRQADSSASRSHGGLGLGLAIVKHVVELHGGEVLAHSEGPGRGARFTVRLPVAIEAPSPRAPAALPEPAAPPASLAAVRVLVVEDEADTREMLLTWLTGAGADVACVESAEEALRWLERFQPDVIVSDVGLPGRDGYAFIRDVRARGEAAGGRTPAVALTAFARPQDRRAALLAGFNVHVAKPVEPGALFLAVAELSARARKGSAAKAALS